MKNLMSTTNHFDYQASIEHYTIPKQTSLTPSVASTPKKPFNGVVPSTTADTTTVTATTTHAADGLYHWSYNGQWYQGCVLPSTALNGAWYYSNGPTHYPDNTSPGQAGAILVTAGLIVGGGLLCVFLPAAAPVGVALIEGGLNAGVYTYENGNSANIAGAASAATNPDVTGNFLQDLFGGW